MLADYFGGGGGGSQKVSDPFFRQILSS